MSTISPLILKRENREIKNMCLDFNVKRISPASPLIAKCEIEISRNWSNIYYQYQLYEIQSDKLTILQTYKKRGPSIDGIKCDIGGIIL